MEEKNAMVENTKKLKPEKKYLLRPMIIALLIEWFNFFQLILNPWFLFLVIIIVLIFLFSYLNVTDKTTALVLNIVASIFTACAGSIIYDRYKELGGNTVLVKKGRGAVRSLFLIVEKVKNVSERLKKGTNNTEAINLLGLLEKDIVLATQEWTDVIPGLVDVELYSNIIKEKELERDEKELQYKEAQQKLEAAKESLNVKNAKEADDANKISKLQKDTEELLKLLNKRNEQISELKMIRDVAISRSTNTSATRTYGMGMSGTSGRVSATGLTGMDYSGSYSNYCLGCGKQYEAQAIDMGYCSSCIKKMNLET